MQNDLVEVEIVNKNGEILFQEYFASSSDHTTEIHKFYKFIDDHRGSYEITIKHFSEE